MPEMQLADSVYSGRARYAGLNGEPAHEHLELRRSQAPCFLSGSWPLKSALLEPFGQQHRPITFVRDCFDGVGLLSTEQEYGAPVIELKPELILDDVREPFEPEAEVGIPTCNVNLGVLIQV